MTNRIPCTTPPALSDETINAALDGILPPEVDEHLRHCAGCTARLHEARQFDDTLIRKLHRWDCPAPDVLTNYHFGMLDSAQERPIVAHLRLCPRCTAEIEDLRLVLQDEQPVATPPTPPPTRWANAILGRLQPTRAGLQTVAVRGEGSAPLIVESSEATIVLRPRRHEREQVQVTGLVVDQADHQERWTDALVEVRRAGALVATAFVDDLGGFNLGPLAAGPAELYLGASGGLAIFVDDLPL